MSKRHGNIHEESSRHARILPKLNIGDTVQVQNQYGNNPLKWDQSAVVVEDNGFDKITVKMDGKGRVSLRNRRYLRKIIPFLPRSTVPSVRRRTETSIQPEDSAPPITVSTDRILPVTSEQMKLRRSGRQRNIPDRL